MPAATVGRGVELTLTVVALGVGVVLVLTVKVGLAVTSGPAGVGVGVGDGETIPNVHKPELHLPMMLFLSQVVSPEGDSL
ncbi:TPA: hypothetical protein HA244_01495 [Candidatus Micrarchaeota archaeon]|nr:hypothetical protein [Candidatus Micrarchaeota archaeon]